MAYKLTDLIINRVDLVDEGANSEAYIELFKRKESKMGLQEILAALQPEQAEVVKSAIAALEQEKGIAEATTKVVTEELAKSKVDLQKVEADLEIAKKASKKCECNGEADETGTCKVCGLAKAAMDEAEVMKSLPEAIRKSFATLKLQKEAAEAEISKAKDAECTAVAIAKAASLKALPVEVTKLVEVLKSAPADLIDMLTTINAAIESTVLDEVGKAKSADGADAWANIEKKAVDVATRDKVTKQRAIATVIHENPELYKEYLKGGK